MLRYLIGGIIGLMAGFIGSMFGISGAFIIIPLLLLFGVCSSQLTAQGTTLCMLLPPISIFAAYTYYKHRHIDLGIAAIMIVFYIIGTLVGSKTAVNFSERRARLNFALLLFLLAGYILYTALQAEDKPLKM